MLNQQLKYLISPLLTLLLLSSQQCLLAGSASSALMSQAMLSMMDAMGNLAQEYNRNKDWSYGGSSQPFSNWSSMGVSPWSMYNLPGVSMPGQQQLQDLVSKTPETLSNSQQSAQKLMSQSMAPPTSPLDGIWQGQGGEIVLVMYGKFRIYASSENYRDGSYLVKDKWITMRDPDSGMEKSYEFAVNEGRMVMRGRDGSILLFRQLPIPVPPYSIFSGQSAAQQQSTYQQAPADQN